MIRVNEILRPLRHTRLVTLALCRPNVRPPNRNNLAPFGVRFWTFLLLCCSSALAAPDPALTALNGLEDLSPTALALSANGDTLYVACATGRRVLVVNTKTGLVSKSIALPQSPLGIALGSDEKMLYVTCDGPDSAVQAVDPAAGTVVSTIPCGHTAMAPVLSADGKTLYVCNRFNNEVAFIDLAQGKVTRRALVPREPVAAALSADGKLLLVANHLHAGRADAAVVAATVSVIDTSKGAVLRELALPNGSGQLRDIKISPDGRWAVVTHLISRFQLPTTQVDRGWINSNAITLIRIERLEVLNSVLLDQIDSGAGNPWAAAWSADSRTLCVTHAGTHELSVIDVPQLLARLKEAKNPCQVPDDLAFLGGARTRLKLPAADRGPRAIAMHGQAVYVANYFSDSLSVVQLQPNQAAAVRTLALGARPRVMSLARRGEFLFNDASICFQGWQSCASCHSSDARVDGLNWDNLNDGIGNPKNVKSLLLAHRTPPAMALGVRETAEFAVRAGLRHSLFTARPEEDAVALDEYLKSLRPIPSPFLVRGKLSPAAMRGKELFFNDTVGCADCHPPPLYTNLKAYDVGTRGQFDAPNDRFDTPTLIELWRTAPYLHDGRAITVKETLTHWNDGDRRGKTSHLTSAQIADLAAFLLSL